MATMLFVAFTPTKLIQEAETYLAFMDEVRTSPKGGWTFEYHLELVKLIPGVIVDDEYDVAARNCDWQ